MAKWRSKRSFGNLRPLSVKELAMEDVYSPEVHISLSDILADVESGKMYIDYPGGIDKLREDAMRERAASMSDDV